MDRSRSLATIVSTLEDAGCVAAAEEADELVAAARHGDHLDEMVSRRVPVGEPLAWITGTVVFCGLDVAVEPGDVRPEMAVERLARRATQLLPPDGLGVDLCTGSGAIAMVMASGRPGALVVGTEIDPGAARCARGQGVTVYEGSLCEPLPGELAGQVTTTGVLPYVPSDALHLLPRDVQQFEPRRALDGGRHGLAVVSAAVTTSSGWLKRGGWLLLEIGADQVAGTTTLFANAGFVDLELLEDGDGDVRGLGGRLMQPRPRL